MHTKLGLIWMGIIGYQGLVKQNERAEKSITDLPNKDIWLKNEKTDKELLVTFAKLLIVFYGT